MICPVCKIDMIDVEYHQIELDYCIKCHGVWFDAEELGLLFDRELVVLEVVNHRLLYQLKHNLLMIILKL